MRVGATVSPSTSIRTWRELDERSTRVYGLRGWTYTGSSSSNQASIASQSRRTRPRSCSIGDSG